MHGHANSNSENSEKGGDKVTVYPENHVVLTPFVNVLTGSRPKQAALQKLTAAFLLLYIATFFITSFITTPAFANEIQDVEDIRLAAQEYALSQVSFDGLETDNIQASAGNLDSRLRLAKCEQPLEAFSMSPTTGFGRVTVGVRCHGSSPWTLYVPVSLHAEVPAMVTTHPLKRGDIVTENDITFVEKPFEKLPNNPVVSLDQLQHMELVRPLNAGTMLSTGMFREKMLIERGQEVVIVAESPGIQVRMAGVALESGKSGQLISVRNNNSGREIEGKVLDGGTVQVRL